MIRTQPHTAAPASGSNRAVVIGTSAGAVEALLQLLPHLPAAFPVPVLIVVHLPPDHSSALVDLFAAKCAIAVKEAEDKEDLVPGTVYFAPPNYHLLVEPDFRVSLSSDEPVLYSRPAIDVLFESAADAWGDSLVGIILSGANNDGAKGLQCIGVSGGAALVQLPETASVPVMPRAALAACPEARALTLAEILLFLKSEFSPFSTQ